MQVLLGHANMRMPHVCGDEPVNIPDEVGEFWYAPRRWG